MATYKSSYTGPQIDQAVSHAVNMDVNPTAGHTDRVVSSGGVKSALNSVEDDIAIRVVGNKTTYASGAAIGQYVIVSGSTITGITDGMYKAAKAIPYNTVIDSTYLTAVSGGAANDLKSVIEYTVTGSNAISTTHTLISARVSKIGHIYTITANIELTSDVSAWESFAQLLGLSIDAVGYYPAFDSSSTGETKWLRVDSNGLVQCSTSIASGHRILISFSFATTS